LEQQLNLQTYVPEVTLHRKGRLQRAPFFPSYFFAALDLQTTTLTAIDSTPGVVRIVRFHDEPCVVSDAIVTEIKLRVDAINAAGGMPTHKLHPGDPVCIVSGPLQGLEGVFDGPVSPAERVQVLLRFLGNERRVDIAVEDIEPARSALASGVAKRPRRSRGAGRPIVPRDRSSTTSAE
jgi:transcriptional antiterminator RfaH